MNRNFIDPMQWDLQLAQEIVIDDMEWGDFSRRAEILPLVDHSRNPIQTYWDRYQESVEANHPTLKVMTPQLFGFIHQSPFSQLRFFHHLLLFEQIVLKMMADLTFVMDLYLYYQKRRQELGVSGNRLKALYKLAQIGNLFEIAKLISIDSAFAWFVGQMQSQDQSLRMAPFDIVALNINEAALTDLFAGFTANFKVGRRLTRNTPCNPHFSEDQQTILFDCSQQWVSQYISWNLAFVIGNLDDLDLILPKLLFAPLLSCQPQEFIHLRVYSLWLTIQFCLFRKLRDRPSPLQRNRQLALAWGHANLYQDL